MFTSGFWQLGSWRGVPIRFHWSVLVGAFVFSGFRFSPAFWLSFPVLVLVHELGHAWVIQRLGHRALAVDVTGFGGLCHWDPRFASRLDHALVAWGGVAAQFVLFLLATGYLLITGGPTFLAEAQVLSVFTTTNLMLIALNLLPFPPLDGARAWMLFGELRKRGFRLPRRKRPVPPPEAWSSSSPHGTGNDEKKRKELAALLDQVSRDARDARR